MLANHRHQYQEYHQDQEDQRHLAMAAAESASNETETLLQNLSETSLKSKILTFMTNLFKEENQRFALVRMKGIQESSMNLCITN